jgi:P27 family predicted phage terminase small subunit
MGERGPPKVPTRLKVLRGTDRPDRGNPDEPQPPPVLEAPPPPARLREFGRLEWQRVAPILVNTRVLTQVDLSCLEAYCRHYQEALEADAFLDANGKTYEYGVGEGAARRVMYRERPEVRQARDAWRDMLVAAGKLGLTPADRTRVRGTSALDDRTTSGDDDRFFGTRG